MDKPVRQQIAELEKLVQQLSQEMVQNRKTLSKQNRLESELRVAQQAAAHYQQVIELERQLQLPRPAPVGS